MFPVTTPKAAAPQAPWASHPTLAALRDSLQITADCWALLAAPDGSSRKEYYLPKGERERERAYRKRLDAARPSGFFRDALRTYAGMLSRGSWLSLPAITRLVCVVPLEQHEHWQLEGRRMFSAESTTAIPELGATSLQCRLPAP